MSYTIDRMISLEAHVCGKCGITFAVPVHWLDKKRADGSGFYCPNGHPRVFCTSTEERLREELEQERLRRRTAQLDCDFLERSRAALRGQVTKIKRRVGRGICPCCNRSFENLRRHMGAQHPEFKEGATSA